MAGLGPHQLEVDTCVQQQVCAQRCAGQVAVACEGLPQPGPWRHMTRTAQHNVSPHSPLCRAAYAASTPNPHREEEDFGGVDAQPQCEGVAQPAAVRMDGWVR